MIYRLDGKLYEEEKDLCGDCCDDCSCCEKRQASAAIQSALDFIKYRKNKLDLEDE
jgi:hypothetical protein